MAQYPDKSEVTFPDEENIQSQETHDFDTQAEADAYLAQLIDQYGEEITSDQGVQNGPVWETVKTYVELATTVVRYVVHRIAYWLTGSRATS